MELKNIHLNLPLSRSLSNLRKYYRRLSFGGKISAGNLMNDDQLEQSNVVAARGHRTDDEDDILS